MLRYVKKIKLFIICSMFLVLSGCWNNRDLRELAIIVGIGIEKVENNEIELTIQIIEPTSGDEGQQSKAKTIKVLYARGTTVFEANRNLLTKVNRKLNYSNIQLMVIGEKLAKNGIGDVLDFFKRVHEIDKRENVLISKGIKPRELLSIESEGSNASTMEIIQTLKNTRRLASIRKITMYDLILNISGENNSVVGIVQISENDKVLKVSNLDFRGAAVIKKDKLVGWLNPKESYGFSIVDNKFKDPIINVPNPVNPDKMVTIEIVKSVAKKDVSFNNNKPELYVEVYLEGNLVEQHGEGNLTSAEQIRNLEAEVSQEIKKIVYSTIKDAQENLHIDIFNFGNIVHKKNITYWEKVKNNWDNVFSGLSIEIKVYYKNKNMGFIKKH